MDAQAANSPKGRPLATRFEDKDRVIVYLQHGHLVNADADDGLCLMVVPGIWMKF